MRISDWSSDVCSSDLQDLSGIGRQAVDLVFVACVELAAPGGPFASHHAVSADHRVGAAAALLVEHQQVVAKIVEGVEVAARCGHLRRRPGRHGLVEHPVAQRLGGPDLASVFSQPDAQIGAGDVDRTIRFGFCETHPAPFPSSRPQPASGVPFRPASVFALAVEADAGEFEAMVDAAIARAAGDATRRPPALSSGDSTPTPRFTGTEAAVWGSSTTTFKPQTLT